MIHIFKAKRVLAVPSEWLNSVAHWCAGVHSPTGTLNIKNTMTPKADTGSLALDVNIDKVTSLVMKAVGQQRELSKTERVLIKGIIGGCVDQKLITYKDGLIGLDVERLKVALESEDEASEDTPAALTLRLDRNSSGSPTSIQVFVPFPEEAVVFNGKSYHISGTDSGWINVGRTSGEVWLNETDTDGELTIASAELGDEDKISILVGSVDGSGYVFQNIVGGVYDKCAVSDDVNTAKIDSGESYFPDDDDPASGYEKLDSTSKWDKGDTDGAASNPKEVGVKFDVITRCAYDADNGIHYFYARTLTFSKSGLLISVGAENAATQVGA